ncbi:hypothetical protein Snoj_25600 [Streptomyces nojiriensis]|uniref:Uncharacterized protein n=1 Tax=Streptomyces nojiriensis TaxID=66374 RepID=A0ABQ3SKZ5_9ACTN|nr:hypothetical protein GCM10010205_69190 [Streptomyces nojiriensis]GHI68642.1 hypothetical protein Snoj_25600 [Streptomyces nojiriensis]
MSASAVTPDLLTSSVLAKSGRTVDKRFLSVILLFRAVTLSLPTGGLGALPKGYWRRGIAKPLVRTPCGPHAVGPSPTCGRSEFLDP